jgi:hypothetical protein
MERHVSIVALICNSMPEQGAAVSSAARNAGGHTGKSTVMRVKEENVLYSHISVLSAEEPLKSTAEVLGSTAAAIVLCSTETALDLTKKRPYDRSFSPFYAADSACWWKESEQTWNCEGR